MCAPSSPKPNWSTAIPGNLQPLAQGVNFRSNVAEVFGEEWQAAQSFAKFVEEIIPRAIDPSSVDRGRIVRRNLPELIEAAEVIEANVVAIARRPAQPVDPPTVPALLQHVPTIERAAPALSCLAEKIRRHSGNHFRIEICIEAKQIGCVHTSALSWFTKIATSPTMRIERSAQYCRSACHCSLKANCSARRISISTASSSRLVQSAAVRAAPIRAAICSSFQLSPGPDRRRTKRNRRATRRSRNESDQTVLEHCPTPSREISPASNSNGILRRKDLIVFHGRALGRQRIKFSGSIHP